MFNAKETLVEHISASNGNKSNTSKTDKLVEDYKKQEKDLRLLTYKILVETFNKKYTSLDDSQ